MSKILFSQIDFFFKAAFDSLLNKLSNIESFKDRIDFAEKNFNHLSSGSSRVIYTIGSNKDKIVAKIAKNHRGIAQNLEESKPSMSCKFINETLSSDPDGYWKTSPFRDKITEKEFEEISGIPFSLFGEAIEYELSDKKKPTLFNMVKDLPLFKELISVSKKNDLMAGDLIRISSWGKSDGNNPHPLLLDAGLTKAVYDEFYDSTEENKKSSS